MMLVADEAFFGFAQEHHCLSIAQASLALRSAQAFFDILKTRRKKKKQDKHLVVLWIIRIFATGTLDYHQK